MRRILFLTVLAILLASPLGVAQVTNRPAPPTTQPRPTGSVGPTPGGVGGTIVIPGPGGGSAQNPADPVWTPPCEGFSMGPALSYVGGGDDGTGPLFAISQYTCTTGGPFLAINCIANCPPGQPVYIPPPPAAGVIDELEKVAPFPIPIFAPPLERGAFAVVGKRIYFATQPDQYRVIVEDKRYPGGWYATATLTPIGLHLTIPLHPTKRCDGPGKDAKTSAGRADNPCFILVDEPPSNHRGTAALGIDWSITVESNILGVQNRTWVLPRTVANDIEIKELQAVVIG
jgi:hypothetical protein